MSTRSGSLLRLACFAAGIPALMQAQTSVWRLGTFDHSAQEFQGREDKDSPAVDVNAADAAAHWPASQAGSLNAHAGSKAHPRTIQFRLDAAPHGVYTLDLAVLLGNPRVPHLVLELNGTPASVYLHRQLSYHAEGRMDSPINGEAREQIPIPAALLRQGENTLRITAVDDAPDENGDSEIAWDALQLLHASAPAGTPTCRWRRRTSTRVPTPGYGRLWKSASGRPSRCARALWCYTPTERIFRLRSRRAVSATSASSSPCPSSAPAPRRE
jgi:hypothetical protein